MEDDITEITSEEIEMALRNMKNGKAAGPDNLPVKVWKSLGRTGVNFLKEALNKITDEENIPDIWRKSILIPIFKNKGDITNYGNSGHQANVSQHEAIFMRECMRID